MDREKDDELREQLLTLQGRIQGLTAAGDAFAAAAEEMAGTPELSDDATPEEIFGHLRDAALAASTMVADLGQRLRRLTLEAMSEFEELRSANFPGRSFEQH